MFFSLLNIVKCSDSIVAVYILISRKKPSNQKKKKKLIGFIQRFFFPLSLEYKITVNKLQMKETSALLMIIITELLSLIIMIKLFTNRWLKLESNSSQNKYQNILIQMQTDNSQGKSLGLSTSQIFFSYCMVQHFYQPAASEMQKKCQMQL